MTPVELLAKYRKSHAQAEDGCLKDELDDTRCSLCAAYDSLVDQIDLMALFQAFDLAFGLSMKPARAFERMNPICMLRNAALKDVEE